MKEFEITKKLGKELTEAVMKKKKTADRLLLLLLAALLVLLIVLAVALIAVIPLATLAAGFVIWLRRRKK